MSCNKRPEDMTEKEKEEHGIPTKANPHPKIPTPVGHMHLHCGIEIVDKVIQEKP